jgi:hypothetical protein
VANDRFSLIGNAWDWMSKTAAPAVGGAWEVTKHLAEAEAAGIGGAFTQGASFFKALGSEEAPAIKDAAVNSTAAAQWVFDQAISRNVAAQTMTYGNPNTYLKPWDLLNNLYGNYQLTGQHVVNDIAWVRQNDGSVKLEKRPGAAAMVDGVSPGQLNAAAEHDIFNFGGPSILAGISKPGVDTADAALLRDQYFNGSWVGRLRSGAGDLALNLVADPTVPILKIGKGASIARAGLKAAHVEDAFKLARGELSAADASKVIAKKGENLNTVMNSTYGKGVYEISQLPFLVDNPERGTFAYFLHRADTEASRSGAGVEAVDEANEIKRNLMGVLFNDPKSTEWLRANQAALKNELDNLMGTPQQSWAVGRFNPLDGGQEMLFKANEGIAPEVSIQIRGISAELTRLNRVAGQTGTGRTLIGTGRQQGYAVGVSTRLASSTIYTGLGSRPIHVIAGALGNRLEGHVNLAEPAAGADQLAEALRQSPHLTGEEQKALLDRFVGASSRIGRQVAVKLAEDRMVQATAQAYGISENALKTLMTVGDRRRGAMQALIKSRLYSAADADGMVTYVDPDTGVAHAIARPLLQTQAERFHSFLDPRQVDRVLKAASGNRWLEIAVDKYNDALVRGVARTNTQALIKGADKLGDFNNLVTSNVLDAGTWWWDVASSFLGKVTRLWKDSVLLMRAPAYALRQQFDSQGRLLAFTGAMGATTSSMAALGRYYRYGISDALKLMSKKGTTYENAEQRLIAAVAPWMSKTAGFSQHEVGMIVRDIAARGGNLADLGSTLADQAISKSRESGDWGWKETTDRDWLPSWVRAVNREIRYSPTAMEAVAGRSPDEIKRFLMSDPKGLAEWNEVADGFHGDIDSWVDLVTEHVNHYLPHPILRDWVLRGIPADMEPMAVEKLFAAGDLKEQLLRDLNIQVPAGQEIKDVIAKVGADAKAAREFHRGLKKELADIYSAKQGGATIDADRVRELKRQQRRAWADYQAKSAKARELAKKGKGALDPAMATEREARMVQFAQDKFANPERPTVTFKDVDQYFSENSGGNRMLVHGTSYTPKERAKGLAKMREVSDHLYREVSDTPETILAKLPLFMEVFNRELAETMTRRAGEQLTSAELNAARMSAVQVAKKTTASILFDSSHAHNIAHHFRFVSPFFAAWEDVMKKWGNLIYERPHILERIRQVTTIPSNVDVRKDQYGNWIVPLSFIPPSIRKQLNLGENWKFDANSVNSIFQGDPFWLPSFGPIVTIPANAIVKALFYDKADTPLVKYLLPFGVSTENPLHAALPAWLKRYIDANPSTPFFGTSDDFGKELGAVMHQEWSKYQRGERDNPLLHLDEMRGKVRNKGILRGLMSQVLPFSIRPTNELQFYFDEAHRLSDKYGGVQDTPQYHAALSQYVKLYKDHAKDHLLVDHPEFTDWYTRFVQMYPGYEAIAVGLSSNDGGLVATDRAAAAARKYADTVELFPGQAWLIAGPDNAYGLDPDQKFSQNAYQLELDQNLRNFTNNPVEAIKRAEERRGWAIYQANATKRNVELDKRGVTLGSKAAADIRQTWNQFIIDLSKDDPYWAETFQSTKNSSLETIQAAKTFMQMHPDVAKRNDMQAMTAYINARAQVIDQLRATGTHITDAVNEGLQQQWEGYVGQLRQYSPGFEQIYNRSLEHDTMTLGVGE